MYGGGGLGLDGEGDVGAWVLLCRPKFVLFTSMILGILCICIH